MPTIGGSWVCTACTFENPNPNALACDHLQRQISSAKEAAPRAASWPKTPGGARAYARAATVPRPSAPVPPPAPPPAPRPAAAATRRAAPAPAVARRRPRPPATPPQPRDRTPGRAHVPDLHRPDGGPRVRGGRPHVRSPKSISLAHNRQGDLKDQRALCPRPTPKSPRQEHGPLPRL